MEAAASKDKRISPNENNLSLSCKGVCQNCRLVRRGDGIARFSFDPLPFQLLVFINYISIMKKAIVFTALAFSAATLSAQYNINLSRVTPPSIEYLKMGNTGPKGKEIRVNNLYMDEGGIPQLPVMGEFHYSRMHPNYWKDALLLSLIHI